MHDCNPQERAKDLSADFNEVGLLPPKEQVMLNYCYIRASSAIPSWSLGGRSQKTQSPN